MTIVEAARTAVLSRNWNRGWKCISKLVFDSSFGANFEKPGQLMLAIHQILFNHWGEVDGFTLNIPWLEIGTEIDPLSQLLSQKKVKHLEIHFLTGNSHVLPSHLFSCFQLSNLYLSVCVFNPSLSFGGFSRLTSLFLYYVDITSDFFGIFISNCPLLQKLHLIICSFSKDSSISIIAPNLRTFCYYGHTLFICFVSAPLLEKMAYTESNWVNFDRSVKLHLDEFCRAVPVLTNLDVSRLFFKILKVRDSSGQSSQPASCLHQLKVLKVSTICFNDLEDVSILLGLMRRSPNLEHFSAQIFQSRSSRPFKILEPNQSYFSCNKLQTVKLGGFDGTEVEMEFVKFLLSNSPQLKSVTIHQDSKDEEKGMQILRKMIRFQRSSTVVDINFCGPSVQSNFTCCMHELLVNHLIQHLELPLLLMLQQEPEPKLLSPLKYQHNLILSIDRCGNYKETLTTQN